jgi:hypothetical protein
MNESKFTQRLLRELRLKMPTAFIAKMSDRYTGGLPDFFVALDRSVTFFEVKLSSNKRIFEPIQLETLKRLNTGMYIIWDIPLRHGDIFWATNAAEHKLSYRLDFKGLVTTICSFCRYSQ